MYLKILSTNILRIMQDKKITQEQLSIKSGISVPYLSEIGRNIANPSIKSIEAIADALEVPLPSLFQINDIELSELAAESGNEIKTHLPKGYQAVYLILTDIQAFEAKRWDKDNKKKLIK
ncbi:MAG: helix-turn-helix domain-containing protein [Nitrosomonas sp.]|nr:helix-turn-helix domain-containing protein [Nitrosomonas sp.]